MEDIKEQLAAIEHERWADWQQWMHDQARRDYNADGEAIYSYTVDQIQAWQKQIETEYAELSPCERASDMQQVNRYWPLIEKLIGERIQQRVIVELQAVIDALDHNEEVFKYCVRRIKTLEAQLKEAA